jgi:hypothetical protein
MMTMVLFLRHLEALRHKTGLSPPEPAEAAGMPAGVLRLPGQRRRERTLGTFLKLALVRGTPRPAFEPPEEEPAPKSGRGSDERAF